MHRKWPKRAFIVQKYLCFVIKRGDVNILLVQFYQPRVRAGHVTAHVFVCVLTTCTLLRAQEHL